MSVEKIHIQNYKSLEDVTISGLQRVNLFTGKNNTGKSSILEAISFFASKGDFNWIWTLLEGRGEVFNYPNERNANVAQKLAVLSSLFRNRQVGFDEKSIMKIVLDDTVFTFRFVRFVLEEAVSIDEQGAEVSIKKRRFLGEGEKENNVSYGIDVKFDGHSQIVNIDDFFIKGFLKLEFPFRFVNSQEPYSAIKNAGLWDQITLSEKEEYIIDALRIIEPDINRLSFVSEDKLGRFRYPIVKLDKQKNIYPLKSMGDGINKVLNLILNLVNADDGFLLIDEFENGLHYSVQEKLWEIIFEIASKLDVQVFATTHSNDSIRSFAKVLESKNMLNGSLYRMDWKKDALVAYPFSKEEIIEAAKQDINLR